jgi:uncharacterized protein (DUF1330 family)
MSAYVLVEMTVTDPVAIEAYRALSGPAVEAHGGRYLARGGAAELLEGTGEPARIVVIEFPDADAARGWYDGEPYRAARAARAASATARFVLVEGLPT